MRREAVLRAIGYMLFIAFMAIVVLAANYWFYYWLGDFMGWKK